MRKRAICMILAISFLLSLGTISACTAEDPPMSSTGEEVVLWPAVSLLADMIPGQNISVQDSSFMTTFPATSGADTIIRVWYKNQTSRPATVIVKQVHWYGSSEVLRFSVPAGQGDWREYTGNSNGYTYELTLESNGGDNVTGDLRVVQMLR